MGEVFICIISFDLDSNLIKDEALLHEVQGGTGRKWQIQIWKLNHILYSLYS